MSIKRAKERAIKTLRAELSEQVTSKLKNPCDSLLTEDSEDSKEQKSKLDLISRADAMGAVQDHFNADGFKGYDDGQKMMDRIKALPSVSADIVRCKDCEYRYEEGDCTCYYWCKIHKRSVDDTDFCSWAERGEL